MGLKVFWSHISISIHFRLQKFLSPSSFSKVENKERAQEKDYNLEKSFPLIMSSIEQICICHFIWILKVFNLLIEIKGHRYYGAYGSGYFISVRILIW